MTAALRTGGCRCGRVAFAARGEPLRVGICHCESCRRATGSAFAVYIDYSRDAVAVTGKPTVWASSPGVERTFCSACGSPVAYWGEPWPDEISLHLGAFARPEEFTPNHVTFEAEGFGWARRAIAPILAEIKP